MWGELETYAFEPEELVMCSDFASRAPNGFSSFKADQAEEDESLARFSKVLRTMDARELGQLVFSRKHLDQTQPSFDLVACNGAELLKLSEVTKVDLITSLKGD